MITGVSIGLSLVVKQLKILVSISSLTNGWTFQKPSIHCPGTLGSWMLNLVSSLLYYWTRTGPQVHQKPTPTPPILQVPSVNKDVILLCYILIVTRFKDNNASAFLWYIFHWTKQDFTIPLSHTWFKVKKQNKIITNLITKATASRGTSRDKKTLHFENKFLNFSSSSCSFFIALCCSASSLLIDNNKTK